MVPSSRAKGGVIHNLGIDGLVFLPLCVVNNLSFSSQYYYSSYLRLDPGRSRHRPFPSLIPFYSIHLLERTTRRLAVDFIQHSCACIWTRLSTVIGNYDALKRSNRETAAGARCTGIMYRSEFFLTGYGQCCRQSTNSE